MTIPDYQTLMLPLLRLLGDGREWSLGDAVQEISKEFHLTPKERQELLPSGTGTVIGSRVGWARTYMKKAGLIDSTRRGFIRATERGLEVLKGNPERIDVKFLEQYPEFVEFRALRREETTAPASHAADATPEESLEYASQRLRESLESELLQRVRTASPAFFERLVVNLLVNMGYGGSIRDASKVVARSRDGGIDGIINEDRLGLDVIYIQAKRWDAAVGRPEIQKFAGALEGHRARKGVFITTSNFTKDAEKYVRTINSKISLIDGPTLARHMVDFKVGVSAVRSYDLLKVDLDYFTEE